MGVIPCSDIKADMVLADDLLAYNGRFLLAKGTRLTPRHIRIIQSWGVVEADIQGITREDADAERCSERDPLVLEAARERVRRRFVHADLDHPAVRELFRICTHRTALMLESAPDLEKGGRPSSKESGEGSDSVYQAPFCVESGQIDPTEVVRRNTTLSTLPFIFMQINEIIKRPDSSARDIADVISRDTSLSARLLKIVNSAFYGFPHRIDTLSRAVAIVGTKQLSTLALGVNIITHFKDIPQELVEMRSFWRHSIACGLLARIIASYKGIRNTERLFVGGLLHDIGRLILFNDSPINSRRAIIEARYENRILHDMEMGLLGLDHSWLGGLLLRKWKLPASLEAVVRYHHRPSESRHPLEPAIVHLSDLVSNALGLGSSGEFLVPPLDPGAWEALDLSSNILALAVNQLDQQFEQMAVFLYGD
ncbi:MAG: HDOD domain-containing protein [Desulfobacteraceae bacterium]